MKPLLKNWLFKNKNKPNNLLKTALPNLRRGCFGLIFMFICLSGISQNLVPNYSFEINDSCPTSAIGQIVNAIPWKGYSVDYYNSCATITAYGVPLGAGGFQYARTGNAHAALFCFHGMPNTREYLQVQLADTLMNAGCYKVTFYANLFNNSTWALNNVALHFSDTIFSDSSNSVVSLSSDVFKFKNPIISDTLNWVEISGVYYANGTEQYISIGNFNYDSSTDTITVNAWASNGGYYLIDDVSVIPIDSIPGGMPAIAGNDVTIIGGDSVFIGQEITNLNCNWYIGATLIADSVSGIFVSPTVNTTYTIEQNLCGTITYDTVTVFVSGVGITESSWGSEINLFPNPNVGEFNLEFKNNAKSDVLIEMVDLRGSLVYSDNMELSSGITNFKLDISNGVYFVHITNTKNHETIVKKLVIQK